MTDFARPDATERRTKRLAALVSGRVREMIESSLRELDETVARRDVLSALLAHALGEIDTSKARAPKAELAAKPPRDNEIAMADGIIDAVMAIEDSLIERFAKTTDVRDAVDRLIAAGDPLVAPLTRGASAPTLPDLSGVEIGDGRYRLVEKIGEGGMGVVYAAKQTSTSRLVAVKLLSATAVYSDWHIHEIEAATRVDHPTIVPVFDAGLSAVAADAQMFEIPWIAMQLVEGARPITVYVKETGLSRRRGIEILRDVAQGLAHAHSQGLIHRDLKPGNILVDRSGKPKLIDFGLSQIATAEGAETKNALDGAGTAVYMPPEEFSDGILTATGRDVYAMGAILCEIATGEDWPTLRQFSSGRFERALTGLPRDLRAVVKKAVAQSPERYATMQAFAEDVARLSRGERPHACPFGLRDVLIFGKRHIVAALALLVVGGFLIDDAVGAKVVRRVLWSINDEKTAEAMARVGRGLDSLAVQDAEGALVELEAALLLRPDIAEAQLGIVFAVYDRSGVEAARKRAQSFDFRSSALEHFFVRFRGESSGEKLVPTTPIERLAAFRRSAAELDRMTPKEIAPIGDQLQKAYRGLDRPSFFFLSQLAAAIAAERATDAAETAIEELKERWPERGASWFWVALLSAAIGRHEDALAAVHESRMRRLVSNVLDIQEADSSVILGQIDAARSAMNVLAEIGTKGARFETMRGRLLAARGDLSGAIDAYRAAIVENPKCLAAHLLLAGAYAQQKSWDDAEYEYRKCLDIDPDSRDIRMKLADVLLARAEAAAQNGTQAAARRILEAAVETAPDHRKARLELGKVLLAIGDVGEAKKQFVVVNRQEPRNAGALKELAMIAVKEDDLPLALRHLANAIAEEPTHVEAHAAYLDLLLRSADRAGYFREACRWLDLLPTRERLESVMKEVGVAEKDGETTTQRLVAYYDAAGGPADDAGWQRLLAVKMLMRSNDLATAKRLAKRLQKSLGGDKTSISPYLAKYLGEVMQTLGIAD